MECIVDIEMVKYPPLVIFGIEMVSYPPLLGLIDNGRTVTRRELYSICGKLIGHFPLAGFV